MEKGGRAVGSHGANNNKEPGGRGAGTSGRPTLPPAQSFGAQDQILDVLSGKQRSGSEDRGFVQASRRGTMKLWTRIPTQSTLLSISTEAGG